jgi:crossover junction endodeoxyribonuclease RuvC
MRILGIDPGYGKVGYGVLDKTGNKFKMVDYGVIYTDKELKLPERLKELHDKLNIIIDKYKPDESCVEELFFFRNVTTAIQVGEARGVILLCLVNKNIPVYEYNPFQIKQAVTGFGRAEKGQVQRVLKILLNLKKNPTPDDAADALAAAFCHGNTITTYNKK